MREKLQAMGARLIKREFQRNHMYDFPDGRLYEQGDGSYVRLRVSRDRDTQQERTLLTVKKTLSRTGFKIADETETPVLDFVTMEQVLKALGLESIRVDEKLRDSYHWQNVVLELDEWAGMPPYLEIEGPSTESITAALAPLGYTLADTTAANLKEVMALYQLSAAELRFSHFGRVIS